MNSAYISKINKNEITFMPSRMSGFYLNYRNNKIKFLKNNFITLAEHAKKLAFSNIKTIFFFFAFAILLIYSYSLILPQTDYAQASEPITITSTSETSIDEIIKFTNKERENFGLNKLYINENLIQLANNRLEDMQELNYFAHTNPKGIGLKQFVGQIDYNYLIVGENLAMNYYDNEEVVQAWMDSPTHRENLLRREFDEIGISFGDVLINNKKVFIIAMILGKEK